MTLTNEELALVRVLLAEWRDEQLMVPLSPEVERLFMTLGIEADSAALEAFPPMRPNLG